MTIFELADSVKHYSNAIYKIILFCKTKRDIDEIITEASAYSEFSSSANTPVEVIKWIIEAGGLTNIPDSSDYEASESGRAFLEEYRPASRLEKFMTAESEHINIIKDILSNCATPQGMGELEERYRGHPAMTPGKLSINYFVAELERAGALEWRDGWSTTDAGKAYTN